MRKSLPTLLAILAIAIVTLLPDYSSDIPVALCLLCGDRGLADALLNLALFAPLGAVLAARGLRWPAILTIGAVASLSIELLQVVIPGRNPSIGDFVFNSCGTLVGLMVLRVLSAWRSDMGAKPSLRRSYVLHAAAVLAVVMGAALLRPAFPKRVYYGQWTPEFANTDHYSGKVVAAEIAGIRLPSARIKRSVELRDALRSGLPLSMQAVKGAPPGREAPVFNIYDDRALEIISIGVEQEDLLIRYRTKGKAIRLDQPTLRFEGYLEHFRVGETWSVQLARFDRALCVTLRDRRECPTAYTAARSWALLLSPRLPSGVERVIDFVWLLMLFIPAGSYLAGRASYAIAALVSVGVLTGVAAVPFLLPLRIEGMFSGAAGLGAGMLLRHLFRARASERI